MIPHLAINSFPRSPSQLGPSNPRGILGCVQFSCRRSSCPNAAAAHYSVRLLEKISSIYLSVLGCGWCRPLITRGSHRTWRDKKQKKLPSASMTARLFGAGLFPERSLPDGGTSQAVPHTDCHADLSSQWGDEKNTRRHTTSHTVARSQGRAENTGRCGSARSMELLERK